MAHCYFGGERLRKRHSQLFGHCECELCSDATIAMAGQTFSVSQDAAGPCVSGITPIAQSFSAAAGTGSVSVAASSGCSWAATSNNASWLAIHFGCERVWQWDGKLCRWREYDFCHQERHDYHWEFDPHGDSERRQCLYLLHLTYRQLLHVSGRHRFVGASLPVQVARGLQQAVRQAGSRSRQAQAAQAMGQ